MLLSEDESSCPQARNLSQLGNRELMLRYRWQRSYLNLAIASKEVYVYMTGQSSEGVFLYF